MERQIRRLSPNIEVRTTRADNLLNGFEKKERELPEPGFEPGNKKTGLKGGNFNNVMVWNIPTLVTCPGASEWCKSVCYNGDDRPGVFHEDKWRSNLKSFNEDPASLGERLRTQLDASEHPLAIRIHSSGDFFSKDYIDFWSQLVDDNPDVSFWAYTRSWVTPQLREPLERLRAKENIQLFASWDSTMPSPPDDWRVSYVQDPEFPITPPSDVTSCPEEFIDDMNCAKCGFCIRKIGRGVLFNVH